jgi:hypothetical protein
VAGGGEAGGAPPESAAQATRDMLTRKKLSSKINYEALSTLFASAEHGDPAAAGAGGGDAGPALLAGARAGGGAGAGSLSMLPTSRLGGPRPRPLGGAGGPLGGQLGSLRPAGAPGSLLLGGAHHGGTRLASVALPTSSLGQGVSGLPGRRGGVSFGGDGPRVTASGATSLGTVMGACDGGAGGTSRRHMPQRRAGGDEEAAGR